MDTETARMSCLSTVAAGEATQWFWSLKMADREKYDRLAEEYAEKLFKKTLAELLTNEHARVHELIRRHYPKSEIQPG